MTTSRNTEDAKIRELKGSMERSDYSDGSRILHFSDGTLSIDDLQDDEETVEEDTREKIDPKLLPWTPWLWYHTLMVGGKALKVCDFLGGHLASFFGITTPKYQLEIQERINMLREEEEERQQELENLRHWSDQRKSDGSFADNKRLVSLDHLERGDYPGDDLQRVFRQPTKQSTGMHDGAGDALPPVGFIQNGVSAKQSG